MTVTGETAAITPGDSRRVAWSTSRVGVAVVVRLENAGEDDRRGVATLAMEGREALLLAARLIEAAARTGVVAQS